MRFFPSFAAWVLCFSLSFAGTLPGQMAPAFTLPALVRGPSVHLHDLHGKVVLVDFWASWCPPCRKSLPELARLQARYPALVVLAVSVDESRTKAIAFLDKKDTMSIAGGKLTALHDSTRQVAALYDLQGMPAAVLIDKQGVLRFRHDGYALGDLDKLGDEVKGLLGEH